MRKVLYLMSELNDGDIEWLAGVSEYRDVGPGEVLVRQGEPVASVYITLRGAFAVSDQAAGRDLARIGGGEVVGEMSFVQAQLPAATVTAVEDSAVLQLPRRALWEKLMADDGFAARFYRALAISLADRLRGALRTVGYAAPVPDEPGADAENLDPAVRAFIRRADHRFEQLVQKLTAAKP